MQHEGWLIVMADCLDALRAIPAESVDVSPTSPPYNMGVEYNQHNDRMPRGAYLAWLSKFFIEMHRILKPGGSLFLVINGSGTKSDLLLPRAIADRAFAAGFVPQNEIAWIKAIEVDGIIRGHCKPVNSPFHLTRMHETILHLTKRGDVPLDKLAVGVPYADKFSALRANKLAIALRRLAWRQIETPRLRLAGMPDELCSLALLPPDLSIRLCRLISTR